MCAVGVSAGSRPVTHTGTRMLAFVAVSRYRAARCVPRNASRDRPFGYRADHRQRVRSPLVTLSFSRLDLGRGQERGAGQRTAVRAAAVCTRRRTPPTPRTRRHCIRSVPSQHDNSLERHARADAAHDSRTATMSDDQGLAWPFADRQERQHSVRGALRSPAAATRPELTAADASARVRALRRQGRASPRPRRRRGTLPRSTTDLAVRDHPKDDDCDHEDRDDSSGHAEILPDPRVAKHRARNAAGRSAQGRTVRRSFCESRWPSESVATK